MINSPGCQNEVIGPSTFESFNEIPSGSQDFLFFCLTSFHIKYCYTTTGGEPGGVSRGEPRGVSQGRYTPYNGLDGEAQPERGTIFRP